MRIHLDEQTEALTERIIGAAFEVSNELGHGFLEPIYEKALFYELIQRDLSAERQVRFRVHYKEKLVGCYYADIVVERSAIIEVKAIAKLVSPHVGQLLNYLKISNLPVGLLLYFGQPRLEFRRVLL